MPASRRYGLAWHAHRDNVAGKTIDDFVMMTASMAMPKGGGMLIDVKDVSGRVFFPATTPAFAGQIEPDGYGGFSEALHYRSVHGYDLFLGVPVLHDTVRARGGLGMVNAFGHRDDTYMCPANPRVRIETIALLQELAALAPGAKIFLPFFRYPYRRAPRTTAQGIPKHQAYCFCEHCREGFSGRFEYPLIWERTTREPQAFHDWIAWRCETIEVFAREIVKQVPAEIVLEVDLCPKRHYFDGVFIDNGHNIHALAEIFRTFVVHVFDRSDPFAPVEHASDMASDLMTVALGRLRSKAKVHLLLWGITNEATLERAYAYADAAEADIRFFVLDAEMVEALARRVG